MNPVLVQLYPNNLVAESENLLLSELFKGIEARGSQKNGYSFNVLLFSRDYYWRISLLISSKLLDIQAQILRIAHYNLLQLFHVNKIETWSQNPRKA